MTTVSLSKSVVLVPQTTEVSTNQFYVTHIQENYGLSQHNRGPGSPNSVEATVVLSDEPYIDRRITVWEGEEYLAVRSTWTDQDLYNKIKQILEA